MDVWQSKRTQLRNLAIAVLNDYSRADDVLQEAFARLLKRPPSFKSEDDAFRYARAVVTNTAIDFYRRSCRHSRKIAIYREAVHEPAIARNPLDLLLLRERAHTQAAVVARLRKAVLSLPPTERRAIEAYFGDEKRRLKDVCAEAGIAYSQLRSDMLRAVDRLRDMLRDEGRDEPLLSWDLLEPVLEEMK